VVKYDGDNVIAKFATCEEAVQGVRAIHADVAAFNEGKEKDFQIRIKLGMSSGEVLMIGHDIVGEAWEDCCLLGEDTAEVGEVLVTESVKINLGESEVAKEFHFEGRAAEADDDGKILKHYNLSFNTEDADGKSAETDGSTSSTTSLSGAPLVEETSGQSSLADAPSLGESSSSSSSSSSNNLPSSAALEAKAKREAKAKAQEEKATVSEPEPEEPGVAPAGAKEASTPQTHLAGFPALGGSKSIASSQSSLSGAPLLGPGPKKAVKDSTGAVKRSSFKGTRPEKIDNRITFGADQVKTFKRGDVLAPGSPSAVAPPVTPPTPPTPKIVGQAPSITVSSPAVELESPASTPSPAKVTKPSSNPQPTAPPPYNAVGSDSDSIEDDMSSISSGSDSDEF